jgi:ribosomal protein S18 acetylase RimI-like enzyme
MRGAVWCHVQPGALALVHPPALVLGEPEATADRLLARVVELLAERRVRLAQALLETDAGSDAERLVRGGFHRAADLLYLVLQLPLAALQPPVAGDLQLEAYRESQFERLACLLEATYVDTRDCPALNGLRPAQEVLAGHRAIGRFDPGLWAFARHQNQDVGCLLLADHPASGQYEVVYMGLTPAARGRGWGHELTRHAATLAQAAGRRQLVLAVDADNAPALKTYAAAGFAAWDRRSVFLRVTGAPKYSGRMF